jgi:hypothetical protein
VFHESGQGGTKGGNHAYATDNLKVKVSGEVTGDTIKVASLTLQ